MTRLATQADLADIVEHSNFRHPKRGTVKVAEMLITEDNRYVYRPSLVDGGRKYFVQLDLKYRGRLKNGKVVRTVKSGAGLPLIEIVPIEQLDARIKEETAKIYPREGHIIPVYWISQEELPTQFRGETYVHIPQDFCRFFPQIDERNKRMPGAPAPYSLAQIAAEAWHHFAPSTEPALPRSWTPRDQRKYFEERAQRIKLPEGSIETKAQYTYQESASRVLGALKAHNVKELPTELFVSCPLDAIFGIEMFKLGPPIDDAEEYEEMLKRFKEKVGKRFADVLQARAQDKTPTNIADILYFTHEAITETFQEDFHISYSLSSLAVWSSKFGLGKR